MQEIISKNASGILSSIGEKLKIMYMSERELLNKLLLVGHENFIDIISTMYAITSAEAQVLWEITNEQGLEDTTEECTENSL